MEPATQANEQLKELFPGLLGMEFTELGLECVKAKLHVRPEVCTVGGILHGGAIMAFADTLGATATVLNLPAGAVGTTTLESKTNFVRAARVGDDVFGETTAIHRGRTTQVWQTRIADSAGRLVALVTQTQMVMTS